ncbi:MAG: DNA topoisomerase 3 [Marinifilaceae bacterium]|jgi:DNA topoisomerase-3|nr:DNA topoisomerase 3 [Marinifilaceae bacterium]
MIVCIAEKPSVAKEIANILGASSRKDGYFEGNGYQVSWTFGHLCTLKEPHEYNLNWKYWYLGDLPIIPGRFGIKLIGNGGVKKQFKILEKLIQDATEVVNCGDAGQEGELIQRWVLHKAKCKVNIKRLWISSLTEEAIRDGFKNLKEGKEFDRLYAAGSSRAIGDWLLGINATRLYTLKYGKNKQVLSIGRVQTPTLALIVNRQNEIENFEPEPYWELKTKYKNTDFSSTKGKFSKKEEAENILREINNKIFEVVSVEKKNGNEYPPKLFDLTSLQVECNRKLNLSADETLRTIQSLYEKKLTTYPRVDTTYLSEDIYPKVGGILKKLTDYKEFTDPILQGKIRKSKKVFDDKKVTDHHAIIPTGVQAVGISYNESKVYEMVARRFISAFMDDCKISNTTVMGKVDKFDFKATGKQILEMGWRKIYAHEKKSDKQQNENKVLPEFIKGENGPHKPDLAEKQTQPPKYYTEASLLRAMETAGKQVDDEELRELMKDNGIGRPSTRANIIETLFKRRYIKKEKKSLTATITGVQLINTIQNELLKSAELTGTWEKKLRQIELGEYQSSDFMVELKNMVLGIVSDVKSRNNDDCITILDDSKKADKSKKKKAIKSKEQQNCPKCKEGLIIKGKSAWGCSSWKSGCDFRVSFEFYNKKITDKQLSDIVTKGKTALIKAIKIDDKTVNAKLKFDSNFNLELETVEEEKLICPICKKGELIKGKAAFGCQFFREGCKTLIPFEFCGKKLSRTHIKQLSKKMKTSNIKGFVHPKTQEKFDAALCINQEGKLSFIK